MEYDFSLKEPLPHRAPPDWLINPGAEQIALVHWITAQVLRLLMEYIDETEQNAIFASEAPFHLFELSEELRGSLGLDKRFAVLFDLFDVSPKLVWSHEDLAVLQRMSVGQLRRSLTELARYAPSEGSFTQLTA